MADENDDQTSQEGEAATTEELPSTESGGEQTTPNAVAKPAGEESPSKSLLDTITESIDEANKPRRIQPKQEDRDQNDTRPRNADGTFKTETPEEKAAREAAEEEAQLAKDTPEEKAARLAAETPEQKAAREAKEAAAKKPDHINDPIPDNMNKRTAERMRYLIDTVKAQEGLAEQHNILFNAIQSTGATPDEFASMVNYMKAVHSNDPKVLESAYTILQSELRGLAIKMGKPMPEVNLLRDPANADLVEEIRAGQITSNRAHEIALMREQSKVRTTTVKTQTDQERQKQEAEAASKQGREDLDAQERVLRAKDGNAVFDAKAKVLIPMLKGLFSRLDPREWKGVFLEHYNNLTVAPPAPVPAPNSQPAERQMPLRPKTPAGSSGASQAPKSALDAINQALNGV